MTYLLVGLGVLGAFLFFARWYSRADARTLLKLLKRIGIGLLVAAALVLIVTGRFGLALAAGAFLLPWVMRTFGTAGAGAGDYSGAAGTGSAGGRGSEIRTRFLHMRLDHASGELDGEIVSGTDAGRRLSDMDEAALIRLLAGYRLEDAQSAQLLEAYLDRAFPEWRQHAAAHQEQAKAASAEPAAMSKEDALRILGLEAGASQAEIKAAYHRLIASLHPDRGGSGYLAAQVNRARDVLLRR
ncbi:MAG: DnaJ domain-containing protein [Rhodospirillales bacterium]|jgi:hypothetical protein|nr:DnaJ domain-containing protein [Rhodospirillales bacterium]